MQNKSIVGTSNRRHDRRTMAAFDFAVPQNVGPRKVLLDRLSVFSTQSVDTDCNNTELQLLYDEYLQRIMIENILEKKAQKKKKSFSLQLAKIAKELDHVEEKLFKLETRERDIINLTKLQNDIDKQIANAKTSIKREYIEKLENTLSQLHSFLQRFDVLQYSNIILPETPEEWKEAIQTLRSCSDTLKSSVSIIDTKTDTYKSVNDGITNFLNIHNTIENLHKRLGKEIGELQVLALKIASLALA
ncbi:uncharacterized protein LOC143342712 [Colletes latitarsis]|uniref:uncharacterized protein LOC143342712 n=1 Tax=Colletes latitarsis TaxID=2605962 RepID=UPI004036BE7D